MKKGAFGGVGGRKGKKGYKMNSQPPMMVNLVVDPSMLGGGLSPSLGNGYKPPSRYDDSGFDDDEDHHETSSKTRKNETAEILYDASRGEAGVEENEEDDHDFDIPDAKAKAERARKARRNNQPLVRMMDTMSVMKLQDRWREARRRMRKMALIDAIWAVTWCAQSLFAIGYGGSCKPGSAAGW